MKENERIRKMKLASRVLPIILIVLTSCVNELDPSMTKKLVANNFKVKVTNYGGFIGRSEITYEFQKKSDSVNVEIIHHFIRPKEIFNVNISESTFEEIKNQILCLSAIESDIDSEYAYQLFDADYLVRSGLKKIFIRPKNQDTCRFYQLLPEYDTLQTLRSGDN